MQSGSVRTIEPLEGDETSHRQVIQTRKVRIAKSFEEIYCTSKHQASMVLQLILTQHSNVLERSYAESSKFLKMSLVHECTKYLASTASIKRLDSNEVNVHLYRIAYHYSFSIVPSYLQCCCVFAAV